MKIGPRLEIEFKSFKIFYNLITYMFTCIIDPDLMSLKVCKYLIEMFFSLVLTELPALHCETLRGKGGPQGPHHGN